MENYLPNIKSEPVIKKLKTILSVEDIFSIFSEQIDTALLNSSLKTDAGRYSYIGLNPFLTLKTQNNNMRIKLNGHESKTKKDPFDCLKSILNSLKIINPSPLPFVGGGIGYFSYDLKNLLEKLPNNSKNDLKVPDLYFCFYRIILIFDRLNPGEIYISALEIKQKGFATANRIIDQTVKKIHKFHKTSKSSHMEAESKQQLSSNFTKKNYIKSIKKIIKYIYAGDIYQVCLSQRFQSTWSLKPYALYLKLNKINPSPFNAFLNFDNIKLISSSPELFLKAENNIIETRPMKGTCPRGTNRQTDKSFKDQLTKSVKDAAELAMIVDLERNDLGKIAVPGTVKVKEPRRIEKYPTVFQSISVITCKKRNDTDLIDIIKAAFPGGSIAGCPKIRAMEIIDELEPTQRGPYTGSIGYLSFHNTMNLNITIRTMIMKGKKVYFQVGGGIVADSDPEKEYEETLIKAKAMMECFD